MNDDFLAERRDAPINKNPSPIWKWAFIIMLLTLGALFLFLVLYLELKAPEKNLETEDSKNERLNFGLFSYEIPEFKKPRIELVSPAKSEPEVSKPKPAPSISVKIPPPTPEPRKAQVQGLTYAESVRKRRLESSLSGSVSGGNSQGSGRGGAVPGEASGSSLQRGGINFPVTRTASAKASRIFDLTFTVPKGTYISCILDTAIQSDQAGLVSCTLPYDIYGADGTVVLLDRGSQVLGEYANATLTAGKRRIFVVWDRVRTPTGVIIDIASPGTGPLGQAGMGGYIDNHYWERVGIPVLMSAVSFGTRSYVRETLTDDQARYIEDATDDSLSTVLGELAKIKPTLYKNQGDSVSIVVSRDLDLSFVYELKTQGRSVYGYRY